MPGKVEITVRGRQSGLRLSAAPRAQRGLHRADQPLTELFEINEVGLPHYKLLLERAAQTESVGHRERGKVVSHLTQIAVCNAVQHCPEATAGKPCQAPERCLHSAAP